MDFISKHPLFFFYSSVKKRNTMVNSPWTVMFPFIVLLILAFTSSVCPCTLFAVASIIQLLFIVLRVGRFSTVSICSERENKTLDGLRLTSLGSMGIITGKMIPDIMELFKVLCITTPFLILMGIIFPCIGITHAVLSNFIALEAGFLIITGLTFLSSVSKNVSSAIFNSWIFIAVWLLVTPLIDSLVATVTLQPVNTPVLSNLNPFLPLMSLLMEGSLDGTRWVYSAYLFPVLAPLFSVIFTVFAAKFIERGEKVNKISSHSYSGFSEKGSLFYRISVIFPIFRNPLFFKEIVSFRKGLVGMLPGILVFIVLLLAPCLYCVDSSMKIFYNTSVLTHHRYVQIEQNLYSPDKNAPSFLKPSEDGVTVKTYDGETYSLNGHKSHMCLRIILYEFIALPLPGEAQTASVSNPVMPVQIASSGNNYGSTYNNPSVSSANGSTYNNSPVSSASFTSPAKEMVFTENKQILSLGFYMGVFLLLSYMVLKFSGFLCNTYNMEHSKLTWDVLTLTGISPEHIVNGKLFGVLFMPLLQMTIGFSGLFFWLYKGVITFSGAISLYIFCISVALVAGIFGQYNSVRYSSAHVSQGNTIGRIILFVLSIIFMKVLFLIGMSSVIFFTLLVISFLTFIIFPSIRKFCIPFLSLMLIFITGLHGSFVYTPFLINSDNFITCNPFAFLCTMIFMFSLGYFFWKNTVEKLRKDYFV